VDLSFIDRRRRNKKNSTKKSRSGMKAFIVVLLLLASVNAQWSDGDEWEWQSRKAAFWVLFGIACACLLVIVIVMIVWCCCPMKNKNNMAPEPAPSGQPVKTQWSSPTAYEGILAKYFAANQRR
jgi:hypothetical protein